VFNNHHQTERLELWLLPTLEQCTTNQAVGLSRPAVREVASAISYDVPQEEQVTSEIIMEVPIFTQETV
jgi:hypothetical protein